MAKPALLGMDSSDWGRSKRRGSALPGVVGETIEATLMLPLLVVGDTRGWGRKWVVVVVGEGVLSTGEGWKPECGGLRTPMPDAAEVSIQRSVSQPIFYTQLEPPPSRGRRPGEPGRWRAGRKGEVERLLDASVLE